MQGASGAVMDCGDAELHPCPTAALKVIWSFLLDTINNVTNISIKHERLVYDLGPDYC